MIKYAHESEPPKIRKMRFVHSELWQKYFENYPFIFITENFKVIVHQLSNRIGYIVQGSFIVI